MLSGKDPLRWVTMAALWGTSRVGRRPNPELWASRDLGLACHRSPHTPLEQLSSVGQRQPRAGRGLCCSRPQAELLSLLWPVDQNSSATPGPALEGREEPQDSAGEQGTDSLEAASAPWEQPPLLAGWEAGTTSAEVTVFLDPVHVAEQSIVGRCTTPPAMAVSPIQG